MSALQERNGSYRVLFHYQGKRQTFTIGAVGQAEAEAKAGQVDLLLLRLSQRLAVIPPGMTIIEYLKFDGRPLPPEAPAAKATRLSTLKDKYLEATKTSLERTTFDCTKTHYVKKRPYLRRGSHYFVEIDSFRAAVMKGTDRLPSLVSRTATPTNDSSANCILKALTSVIPRMDSSGRSTKKSFLNCLKST